MIDENITQVNSSSATETKEAVEETSFEIAPLDTAALDLEAEKILNELVPETDINKAKDLTYLFNWNQNKKTMVRMNKQSELLDILTDATIARVKDKPSNLSNDDLNKLMKTAADLLEKGHSQINSSEDAPLIQINQQNNEVNMDGKQTGLSRDSREKVKTAVVNLLKQVAAGNADVVDNIIEETTTIEETKND